MYTGQNLQLLFQNLNQNYKYQIAVFQTATGRNKHPIITTFNTQKK